MPHNQHIHIIRHLVKDILVKNQTTHTERLRGKDITNINNPKINMPTNMERAMGLIHQTGKRRREESWFTLRGSRFMRMVDIRNLFRKITVEENINNLFTNSMEIMFMESNLPLHTKKPQIKDITVINQPIHMKKLRVKDIIMKNIQKEVEEDM
uniref:Uncharacterized protein n=1 Tax=Cacopsylla melanoneura TaxID=428564 RepID=A0A8D8U0Y3_9HEMI